MKKYLRIIACLLLLGCLSFSILSCGDKKQTNAPGDNITTPEDDDDLWTPLY